MGIKNVFGKGGSCHGKHSSQLNLPSQSIDRRKNASYRSSKPKRGKLIEKDGYYYVLFKDGSEEKTTIKVK